MNRVIPETLWVLRLVALLPFLLWYWWGCFVPLAYAWPRRKKRIDKQLESLTHLPRTTAPDSDFDLIIGFDAIGLRDVPRTEAIQTLCNLGLDMFGRSRFARPTQNPGHPDLKELRISHRKYMPEVTLFIENYTGINKPYLDFKPGDQISLIIHNDYPISVYNHNTHVLVNCDYWGLYVGSWINSEQGVNVRAKGKGMVGRVQSLIMKMRKEGQTFDTGRNASRVADNHHSYDEEPLALYGRTAELHEWLFFAGLGAAMLWIAVLIIEGL